MPSTTVISGSTTSLISHRSYCWSPTISSGAIRTEGESWRFEPGAFAPEPTKNATSGGAPPVARHAAIVRLEQLYPLRAEDVLSELSRYPAASEVAWVQEEPRNMGAWDFVNVHLGPRIRERAQWSCVSRPPSASPASGSATRHKLEQESLAREALGEARRAAARRAREA